MVKISSRFLNKNIACLSFESDYVHIMQSEGDFENKKYIEFFINFMLFTSKHNGTKIFWL